MPANVTRGRIAKTMPAVTPTARRESSLPSTTTPAAATATATALGSRDHASDSGKTTNQPCIRT